MHFVYIRSQPTPLGRKSHSYVFFWNGPVKSLWDYVLGFLEALLSGREAIMRHTQRILRRLFVRLKGLYDTSPKIFAVVSTKCLMVPPLIWTWHWGMFYFVCPGFYFFPLSKSISYLVNCFQPHLGCFIFQVCSKLYISLKKIFFLLYFS